MEKVKINIQERIFLKGDYDSIEGMSVNIDGVNYKIGKVVLNPILLLAIPLGDGELHTGKRDVREGWHVLAKKPIHLGIYYYTRLEGEKCAVVDAMMRVDVL